MGMGLDEIFWWPFAATLGGLSFVVGILVVAFWVWMIFDVAQRKFKKDLEKVLWVIAVVIGFWIGALAYLIVIKLNNPRGIMRN